MIVGITGGIATGKSLVTEYIKNKGYFVIDSDSLAHEALTKGKDTYKQIVSIFDCLDENKEIDRKKLGKIVFNDHKAKKILEDIIHPYVFSRIEEEKKKNSSNLTFIDMPLLFEVGYENRVDLVISVVTNEVTQALRLSKRDNISLEYAKVKISNQMSLKEKIEKSDYVIDNSNSINETYKAIDNVLENIKKMVK